MTEDLSYLDFVPSFECEISTHGTDPDIHDDGGGVYALKLTCPECELVMTRVVCEMFGVLLVIDASVNGGIQFGCPQCGNINLLEAYRLEILKI